MEQFFTLRYVARYALFSLLLSSSMPLQADTPCITSPDINSDNNIDISSIINPNTIKAFEYIQCPTPLDTIIAYYRKATFEKLGLPMPNDTAMVCTPTTSYNQTLWDKLLNTYFIQDIEEQFATDETEESIADVEIRCKIDSSIFEAGEMLEDAPLLALEDTIQQMAYIDGILHINGKPATFSLNEANLDIPIKDDIRLVDGILFINGQAQSTQQNDNETPNSVNTELNVASDTPVESVPTVSMVDGKIYLNGKPATSADLAALEQSVEINGRIYGSGKSKSTPPRVVDMPMVATTATVSPLNSPEPALASIEKYAIPTALPVSATTVSSLKDDTRLKPSALKVLLANLYNEAIPCFSHYDGSWDNRNIHAYRYDLTKMPETVEFFLTHGLGDDFVMPVYGQKTSGFGKRWGRYHNGIDLDLSTGDPVQAAFEGKVRIAQYSSSYGYVVVIRHFNGLETIYAHLSKLLVSPNQDVKAGDRIGLGGNTGRSRGSHLHFEVRYKGHPLDPSEMIDFGSFRLKSHTFIVDKGYFSSDAPYEHSEESENHRHSGEESEVLTSTSSSSSSYHVVRRGDTLFDIASQYGMSVKEICTINRLSTRTRLNIGQRLKVK